MKYSEFLIKYKRKIVIGLILLGILLKIFIIQTSTHSLLRYSTGNIALVIAILGILLRSWATGMINKGKTLTCNGPFHLCRNPQYLGSLLIGIGVILALNSVYLWVLFIILPLVYMPKIKAEERYLMAVFKDDFQKYKRLTGMFYPKKISFGMFLCNWSCKQWLKNKEYNTWIAAIVGGILFETVKTFTR